MYLPEISVLVFGSYRPDVVPRHDPRTKRSTEEALGSCSSAPLAPETGAGRVRELDLTFENVEHRNVADCGEEFIVLRRSASRRHDRCWNLAAPTAIVVSGYARVFDGRAARLEGDLGQLVGLGVPKLKVEIAAHAKAAAIGRALRQGHPLASHLPSLH